MLKKFHIQYLFFLHTGIRVHSVCVSIYFANRLDIVKLV